MFLRIELHQKRGPSGWKAHAKFSGYAPLSEGDYGLEIKGLGELDLNLFRVGTLIESFFTDVFKNHNPGIEGPIIAITLDEKDFKREDGLSDETLVSKMKSMIPSSGN